jgi:hypothetical protein
MRHGRGSKKRSPSCENITWQSSDIMEVFKGYIQSISCFWHNSRSREVAAAPSTPLLYHTIHAQPSSTPLSFRFLNSSGSRNLLIVTSSARPFLLLVLSTKSRARACAVAGSRGRSLISLSSGSPGTIDQRSKTRERDTWPCVWICGSLVNIAFSICAVSLPSDRSRNRKSR